jgi:uncharacterized membrane protein YfcA
MSREVGFAIQTFILVLVFFVTSGISVVTGSTSVITVPVMFQFGIDPRTAVATNMFALTFMSFGGTLPFLKSKLMDRTILPVLIALTIGGSMLGALLLLIIPARIVPIFVSFAILALAVWATFYRSFDVQSAISLRNQRIGYLLTFILGIYGGMFSGGYVTILTAVLVASFRTTFLEAIAITKLLNIFSSGVATLIFMWRGLVDYRLGVILATTTFVGALLGARFASRLRDAWLRRIYLAAVWLLALKTLFFDVIRNSDIRVSAPSR